MGLYTFPSDVFDWLGTEGAQLRLDDHVQATGQQLQVTVDAAAAATTISVAAIIAPLIRGTVVEFDGGAMPAVVEVTLNATAKVGDTSLTVNPLSAAVLKQSAAYDSGVNVALAQRLVVQCLRHSGLLPRWQELLRA